MLPYFTERFGNPASRQHAYGWDAQKAVDTARAQVAALIGAVRREIVFTSGASESNNLAIKGVGRTPARPRRSHHHRRRPSTNRCSTRASSSNAKAAGSRGSASTRDGFVDLDELRAAIADRTVLVSVMAANNEIGVLQPLAEIGAIAQRAWRAASHRCRAGGRQGSDRRRRDRSRSAVADRPQVLRPEGRRRACTCAARKPQLELTCQIDGGGHENGLRSGTLNVPGIVGLGRAAEICRDGDAARVGAACRAARSAARRPAAGPRRRARQRPARRRRLPHNLHVSFDGVEGEALLMALGDLAVSTGSACSSGSQAPSHVLKAIGAVGDAPAPRSASASAASRPTRRSISPSSGSRRWSRACERRESKSSRSPAVVAIYDVR